MKKCVIMGNGPSLNDVDINALKDVDTFSFNRAYIAYEEWGFTPTYYGVSDKLTLKSCYDGIEKILDSETKKIFLIRDEVTQKYQSNEKVVLFYQSDKSMSWLRNEELFGKYDINNLPNTFDLIPCTRGSVCITAICFLYLLGYTDVCMVGMDGNYKKRNNVEKVGENAKFTEDNDINHFRKDYFGKDVICNIAETINPFGNSKVGWEDVKSKLDVHSLMNVYISSNKSNLKDIFKTIDVEKFIGLK